MARAMAHRGPDEEAIWGDGNVGFAFRRLAVIDLHRRSCQPLHLGRWHLVFNGEIYNYPELREELRALGHTFDTEGDAEVLLHSWSEWGEQALDRFDGMFAFAVWDDAEHRLTLAVDRFAEKPLCFCTHSHQLLFASDVRALRVADDTLGMPDLDAVNSFLALGAMPDLPHTFYADVRRLPPAHLGRWERGHLTIRRYWAPKLVTVPGGQRQVIEQLRDLLFGSVRRRLRSDVTVGTSLSGGIDSSAILSVCARTTGGGARLAFTARFPGFVKDEWPYAEETAKQAHVAAHHAVEPTAEELLADVARLVVDQEEPFGSTSIYAQWRVMQAARQAGVTVMLDGQGADELFGGYGGTVGWALRATGLRAALAAVANDRALLEGVVLAYAAGRVPPAAVRRHRLRRASPYVSRDLAAEAARSLPPIDLPAATPNAPLRGELLRQLFHTSLPTLCRYADRNSMAHGVEVRLPFLDRQLVEFALSLPPGMVYRDGVTKYAFRTAMRDLVPDRVLDRREKIGYETPEQKWFDTPAVRQRLAGVLLDHSTLASGRYDAAAIERDIAAGRWRNASAVWRIVNVEIWLRSLRGATSGTA
jgi:asparagine synthase (glutamine-hydrolysing)